MYIGPFQLHLASVHQHEATMFGALLTDTQKIGMGLVTIGGILLFLGVILMFDTGLLAMGNLLLIAGLVALIGPASTVRFFAKAEHLRGTICFVLGISMVIFGWPVIGMFIEIFGIINLFGNFFPRVLPFLRRIPFIGPVFDSVWVTKFQKLLGISQNELSSVL